MEYFFTCQYLHPSGNLVYVRGITISTASKLSDLINDIEKGIKHKDNITNDDPLALTNLFVARNNLEEDNNFILNLKDKINMIFSWIELKL